MELDEDLKFVINASGNFIRITPIHSINYFSELDCVKNWVKLALN